MGLLDMIERPEGIGLLSGLAGWAANARRGAPINSIGRGLVSGLYGYQTALQDLESQRRQRFEEDQALKRNQMLDLQLTQAQDTQARREAFRSKFKPAGVKPFEADNPFGEDLGNLQTETPATFAGKPVNPMLAEMAQVLEPEQVFGAMNAPEAKPQLVTTYENGRPVQKWVRPGEADGVVVGEGKPENQSNIAQLMTEMNNLPTGDPRRRVYQDAINKATTHQPGVNVNYGAPVAGVDAQGNPVFFQPSKAGGTPAIIPGVRPNDQGQTPENAGKIAMAQQAIKDLDSAESLLFGSNGRLNNNVVWGMNVPGFAGMPGNTPARDAYSAIQNAVAAKLRLETGAAANQSEVENIARRFMPTPADTPQSARSKLSRLREFFSTSLSQTKGVKQQPGRKAAAQMSDDELLKALGE